MLLGDLLPTIAAAAEHALAPPHPPHQARLHTNRSSTLCVPSTACTVAVQARQTRQLRRYIRYTKDNKNTKYAKHSRHTKLRRYTSYGKHSRHTNYVKHSGHPNYTKHSRQAKRGNTAYNYIPDTINLATQEAHEICQT